MKKPIFKCLLCAAIICFQMFVFTVQMEAAVTDRECPDMVAGSARNILPNKPVDGD